IGEVCKKTIDEQTSQLPHLVLLELKPTAVTKEAEAVYVFLGVKHQAKNKQPHLNGKWRTEES
ncbi:MAG: hypothetical protein HW384_629, partial [Dehalococcoidia bacterium]|nr:hypothetical protein [Dehalococcoidia bacterium]